MRIEYVSKLLDHSDIGTTQIYAKIVNEELDKAVEQFIEQLMFILKLWMKIDFENQNIVHIFVHNKIQDYDNSKCFRFQKRY